jgi:hypothetical protein
MFKKVRGSYVTLVDDRGGSQDDVRLIDVSGANVGNPCTCTLEFEGA